MGRRIRYRPSRVSEQLPAPESMGRDTLLNSQTIITVGVVWIVILVVMVLVGYFVMQNRQFQNEFAPLVDVCRGKWVKAASTYSPTPGKHPAVGRSSFFFWAIYWTLFDAIATLTMLMIYGFFSFNISFAILPGIIGILGLSRERQFFHRHLPSKS